MSLGQERPWKSCRQNANRVHTIKRDGTQHTVQLFEKESERASMCERKGENALEFSLKSVTLGCSLSARGLGFPSRPLALPAIVQPVQVHHHSHTHTQNYQAKLSLYHPDTACSVSHTQWEFEKMRCIQDIFWKYSTQFGWIHSWIKKKKFCVKSSSW